SRSPMRSRWPRTPGSRQSRTPAARYATTTRWPLRRHEAWRSQSRVAAISVTDAAPQVGFRSVTARILDGKAVAGQIRTEVADRGRALSERGVNPGLGAAL